MGHENSKHKAEKRYDNEELARKATACSAANMDAICPAGRHRSNSAPNENDVEEQPDRSPRPPKRHVKHFLPKRERVILLNCWKKTKKTGPDHVGIKIFYMILTAQPDIKDIFDLEKVAAGQLKYDTRFRQQAASE